MGILTGLWGQLAGYAGAAFALVLLFLQVKHLGRKEAQSEQYELDFKNVKVKNEVQNDVAGASRDDLDKRVSKWFRD